MNRFAICAAALIAAATLSPCETMQPATYANYGDNTFALRKLDGAKVRLSSLNDQSKFDSGCRMVGPIKAAGSRPVAEFIKDAFNDELKFAGLYSDDQAATELTATLR